MNFEFPDLDGHKTRRRTSSAKARHNNLTKNDLRSPLADQAHRAGHLPDRLALDKTANVLSPTSGAWDPNLCSKG
jgi:hypothetical protein